MPRITYDYPGDDPPTVGDTLICMSRRTHQPTGTAYLILAARRVSRKEPVEGEARMAYIAERVELEEALKADRFDTLVWYTR